jgi:hypothetical protein
LYQADGLTREEGINVELQLRLKRAVPDALIWIDRLLVAHQSRARTVGSYPFRRLPVHYTAELLATTQVVEVERLPMLPLSELGFTEFSEFENGQYGGITFKDTYFVNFDEASRESLHFHELVHVIQWRYLGEEKFLMAYALGYLQVNGPNKYRNNPLEVMAYELQHQFERETLSVDVQTEVHGRLDVIVPALFAKVS